MLTIKGDTPPKFIKLKYDSIHGDHTQLLNECIVSSASIKPNVRYTQLDIHI